MVRRIGHYPGKIMNKATKIFVAGHEGMTGAALLRRLRSQGYTGLLTRTRRELDLLDQAAVREFFFEERPEYVCLMAERIGGPASGNAYPADLIRDNILIQA